MSEVLDTKELRRRRVRRQRKTIVWSSALTVALIPVWAFLRLFYCWEDSCDGFYCALCDLHLLITGLLLLFLAVMVWMALVLMKISDDDPQKLPDSVENPWVPGAKSMVAGAHAVSRGAKSVVKGARKIPGAATAADSVARFAKTLPGSRTVSSGVDGLARGLHAVAQAGKRFEHGRALSSTDSPGTGTFIFACFALAAGFFMAFGPFNSFFFP